MPSETTAIEIRKSEVAGRLLELAGSDTLSEAQTAELDGLRTEAATLEARHQAALEAERLTADVRQGQALGHPAVPRDRELAELRQRSSLVEYGRAAFEGRDVGGPESELRQALCPQAGADRVPLAMLADPVETRATAGVHFPEGVTWRTADGVFDFPLLSRLGIRPVSVPTGQMQYQGFAGPATVTRQPADGTNAAADSTLTARQVALDPTRLTARVDFQVGQSHQVDGLEREIRAMLTRSLSDAMEADALVGGTFAANATQTWTSNSSISNPLVQHAAGQAGKGDSTPLAAAPAAQVTYADMVGQAAQLVDGHYSADQGDIVIVASLQAYRHAWSQIQTDGDLLAGEVLGRTSGGFVASDRLPGKATTGTTRNKIANLMAVRSAISNHAVMPVWDSFSLIRDMYSDAASGGMRLVVSAFWNFGVIPFGRGGAALAAGTGCATMLAWQIEA